jgi:hypothetical protein
MNPFYVTTVSAQNTEAAKALLNKFYGAVIDPLILLAFMVAMVVFIWGIVQFMYSLDNATKRAEGRQHMIWGVVGMTIMVSVYGILELISGLVGNNSLLK